MSKIIVIGGGASGLTVAITTARRGSEVLLLERNSMCGKKILITGNGRCNYFNDDFTKEHYNSTNRDLIESIINDNSKKEILSFFDSIGVIPKIKNGYYYPYSNQAVSIKNALVNEAINVGVKIIYDTYVESIEKSDEFFILKTNNKIYKAEKIVVATGSCAYEKTGSDGLFYNILEKLGHSIIKPLPSLVQLKGKGNYFKEWKGIREDVILKLYENEKFIKEEVGEVQLTDYGISGICTMQLSGLTSRGLDNGNKEKIVINFFPKTNNIEEFINFIDNENTKLKNRTISELLENIMNYKLVNLIIKKTGYKNTDLWNEIDKEKLAKNIICFEIEIIGTNSFDMAQTTTGGISLEDVDLNTMESKIIKGLYITGELLDIDGECGGYNLSLAWISGIKAGSNI